MISHLNMIYQILDKKIVTKMKVMEQEVIDMTNAIARDGLVFFPDFCSVVLMKFRFLTTFFDPLVSFY